MLHVYRFIGLAGLVYGAALVLADDHSRGVMVAAAGLLLGVCAEFGIDRQKREQARRKFEDDVIRRLEQIESRLR